jgi:hypothetical protein
VAKRGRPSDYKPEFADQAAKLCRLGATDQEIADFFGKDERTINRWKIDHPDFCQAEPPRVCRRPFGLSYAAMADCSSIA